MKSDEKTIMFIIVIIFMLMIMHVASKPSSNDYENCYPEYGGGIGGTPELICE
jgi:hypothetical protein